MGDADGASALQQFCLLAKSAKGAACTSLITQALEHQGVFVFGELLDMPCVKEVCRPPARHRPSPSPAEPPSRTSHAPSAAPPRPFAAGAAGGHLLCAEPRAAQALCVRHVDRLQACVPPSPAPTDELRSPPRVCTRPRPSSACVGARRPSGAAAGALRGGGHKAQDALGRHAEHEEQNHRVRRADARARGTLHHQGPASADFRSAPRRRIPACPVPPRSQISSVREVEDLLIRCIYGELLNGKLDQQLKQLDVHTCIGRDIHPSEIATMLETLSQWHDTSLAVLGSLHDNIGLYKTQCEEARNAQSALTKKVDEVKATLRAQQDAGDAMRDDFEGGMDYDDDKMRKSGRAKLKHGLGVAPRGGSHR